MLSSKSRLFQDFPFNYTPDRTIWSSKFQKISGEGITEPPPQTPTPRSFSGFDLDSGFAVKSQALRALDSGFARFGPPTFEAWLRPLPNSMLFFDQNINFDIIRRQIRATNYLAIETRFSRKKLLLSFRDNFVISSCQFRDYLDRFNLSLDYRVYIPKLVFFKFVRITL